MMTKELSVAPFTAVATWWNNMQKKHTGYCYLTWISNKIYRLFQVLWPKHMLITIRSILLWRETYCWSIVYSFGLRVGFPIGRPSRASPTSLWYVLGHDSLLKVSLNDQKTRRVLAKAWGDLKQGGRRVEDRAPMGEHTTYVGAH